MAPGTSRGYTEPKTGRVNTRFFFFFFSLILSATEERRVDFAMTVLFPSEITFSGCRIASIFKRDTPQKTDEIYWLGMKLFSIVFRVRSKNEKNRNFQSRPERSDIFTYRLVGLNAIVCVKSASILSVFVRFSELRIEMIDNS